MTIDAKKPTCFLHLLYQLVPDPEQEHLTVRSSAVGVSTDAERQHELFRYDYERDKGGGYPEAHLQVYAESEAWREQLQRCVQPDRVGRPLNKLHFPVGGRRYRPTLEDVLEFLIAEGFARARPKWQEVLDRHRQGWSARQLKAAIRRDPDTAIEALKGLGLWPA